MGTITTKMMDPRGIDPKVLKGAFANIPGQKVRYVQSTHLRASNLKNQGLNQSYPLATLVKALALSSAYDTIIMMPGHVETVSAANGLDINKVGVSIYGMGGESTRPQIKVGTLTTASIRISAADVVMDNFEIITDIDSLAVALSITAAGAKLSNFRCEDSASKQALVHLDLAVGANYTRINGMRIDDETAGSVSAIKISGACAAVEITDCILGGDFSAAPIDVTAAALRLEIGGNVLRQVNASNIIIQCGAVASTGVIHDNRGAAPTNIAAPYTALITMGAGCLWTLHQNFGATVAQQTAVVPIGVLDA